MAVPRPVLLAILGLAVCVAALVAVRGVGGEEPIAPAPIPTAPATKSETPKPGTRGRARASTGGESSTKQAKPAEKQAAKRSADRKVSAAEVAKLKNDALLLSAAKALGQNDVVVLFFSRPGAADDTGARASVAKLEGVRGVQVFSPRFEDLKDYRPVLAGTGVAQVPAIVIVKPGRKAQLVEGFVDRQTLRQQVEDAAR